MDEQSEPTWRIVPREEQDLLSKPRVASVTDKSNKFVTILKKTLQLQFALACQPKYHCDVLTNGKQSLYLLTRSHIEGTRPSNMHWNVSSKSADISTRP